MHINSWGWVDVGFSHSIEDYDRRPLPVEQLTYQAAAEIIEMRAAMTHAYTNMHEWRGTAQDSDDGSDSNDDNATPASALECIDETDERATAAVLGGVGGGARDSLARRREL